MKCGENVNVNTYGCVYHEALREAQTRDKHISEGIRALSSVK